MRMKKAVTHGCSKRFPQHEVLYEGREIRMSKCSELIKFLLLAMDTTLWRINNYHSDALAESAFFKIGGTTLAEVINNFADRNEETAFA